MTLNLDLRVFGYREGDLWVAHCLEMDLLGHGKTFKSALGDLLELIEMQVSFALQEKDPSMIYRPAPHWVWAGFERIQQEAIQRLPRRPRFTDAAYSFLSPEIDTSKAGEFAHA